MNFNFQKFVFMCAKTAICAPLLLILSACITFYDDQQLLKMDDAELCGAMSNDPGNRRLIVFMKGRNLHCHPAQITCKNAGFKKNTKAYEECVSQMFSQVLDEKAAAERQMQELIFGISQALPGTVRTTCLGGQGSMMCATR